jgi:serine/threonine protein kinase
LYSDGLTKLEGIDLDHAVRLHVALESLPAVTWTYAAPEVARKAAGEDIKAYADSDLWSLGSTLMEIFNKGQSIFSRSSSCRMRCYRSTLLGASLEGSLHLAERPCKVLRVGNIVRFLYHLYYAFIELL